MMDGKTKRTDGNKISKTSIPDILYLTYFRLKENRHLINTPQAIIGNSLSSHEKQSGSDLDKALINHQTYESSSTRSNEYSQSIFYEIGI